MRVRACVCMVSSGALKQSKEPTVALTVMITWNAVRYSSAYLSPLIAVISCNDVVSCRMSFQPQISGSMSSVGRPVGRAVAYVPGGDRTSALCPSGNRTTDWLGSSFPVSNSIVTADASTSTSECATVGVSVSASCEGLPTATASSQPALINDHFSDDSGLGELITYIEM